MYKAVIFNDAYLDDYEHGELDHVNSWTEEYTADTTSELRRKVLDATYSNWKELDAEQLNEYEHATEYHTSYLTDENNEGAVSQQQIDEWRQGNLKLYAVHCHILVSKVAESKAEL